MRYRPQFINLSSDPSDIVATMASELVAVRYQKRKAYGGTRKYEAWKQQLHDKSLSERQDQLSELTEYISPAGNRWIMYSNMEYLPDVHRVLPCHAAFIYYETYGSCGAFFPLFPYGGLTPNGVTIFTSHFFLRLSERTGIPFRSKTMVQEFVSRNFMRSVSSSNHKGGEVSMRFRCGYGLGVVRSTEPFVIEMRTFLADEQLSESQRKRLRIAALHARIVEKLGDRANDVTILALEHMTYFFLRLAQQWNGFNPNEYLGVELMSMVADNMSPTQFDAIYGNGKFSFQDAEMFSDSICDTIIRTAESKGFEGWTKERVLNGIARIVQEEEIWDNERKNEGE